MRRRLAIHGRIEGEDHFPDAFARDTVDQAGDAEIFGADFVQCRKRAAKDVIATTKGVTAFERPKVGHVLHHADFAIGAGRIGADRADVAVGDITAGQAFA